MSQSSNGPNVPPDEPVPALPAMSRVVPFPTREGAGRGAVGLVDETALVAACRRGNRAAMERLYVLHRRRVFNLIIRIAGAAVAEELSQEVFIKIFKNLVNFRGDSQLTTWIYRLTVNTTLTYMTRRPRHLPLDEQAEEPAAAEGPLANPALRLRIERAMKRLPDGYRAVLVLHDVEGLNHEEIADILGCRVGTSKSQLHKARLRMRELLGPID